MSPPPWGPCLPSRRAVHELKAVCPNHFPRSAIPTPLSHIQGQTRVVWVLMVPLMARAATKTVKGKEDEYARLTMLLERESGFVE